MATQEVPTIRPSNRSSSSISDEKVPVTGDSSLEVAKDEKGVDVVAELLSGHAEDAEMDPEVARKVRNKLDWHMLPLLFALYTLQFIDKGSLASSSILGVIPDNHLNANQFNNLSTAFYIGYIIFVWPHAYLMQRLPIGKYIAANIFFWAVCMGLQAACKNYGGLFALRFLLGASEGCITSGIMTIMTMFYTRVESTQRISWTFQCNGVALILSGFIAFGVAHMDAKAHPRQWQWFMIITSIASLVVSILYFWYMPDNPANAKFLTKEEKVLVVQRLRINQNGVETKAWKKYQFIEAIKDPKTWLFFFFAAIANLQGGIGVVYQIIISGYGFNTLETTLLSVPKGVGMIIGVTIGTIFIRRYPNSHTFIGIIGFIPSSIACFLLLFLPWSAKPGLLVGIYLISTNGVGFIMILSLCAVSFAGHTKKMTVNAIFLVGYSLGQMLCSQFWKEKYRPRNTVPWIIQLMTYVGDIILILIIRWYLSSENKRRDREKLESGKEYDEFGYIERVQEDGSTVKYKVPIQFLDITDLENKAFRYSL
ncbi:hypothetical protein M407DRAFT_24622 [Tulasnella calospora MUT 4182]|uniref:Major facilitator superfamily (MFS) profile domain-containing protein n=1 Tax=Tulasnella calospora MUT 4182 TaxID=1051891 RepID=A0A0C3LXA3_9AGAM|nr:hypothetical protein M407DRAFT_24622 [Tulasnella calospora MUT 4182]